MGIPPTRFRQYPHEFSGGMRQRIMIALALVLRPKLLIADEPTTSLDVIVEAQILSILADLRENFGTALLLITHNLGIVAEACDRVAVMYAGEIVEEGDARDVFAEPAHPYTQALLRSTISLETTELHSIPGRSSRPDRAASGVPLPPPLSRGHVGVRGQASCRGADRPPSSAVLAARPGRPDPRRRRQRSSGGRRSALQTRPERRRRRRRSGLRPRPSDPLLDSRQLRPAPRREGGRQRQSRGRRLASTFGGERSSGSWASPGAERRRSAGRSSGSFARRTEACASRARRSRRCPNASSGHSAARCRSCSRTRTRH